MAIYKVTLQDGSEKLVDAKTAMKALEFAVRSQVVVKSLSASEAVEAIQSGKTVEKA